MIIGISSSNRKSVITQVSIISIVMFLFFTGLNYRSLSNPFPVVIAAVLFFVVILKLLPTLISKQMTQFVISDEDIEIVGSKGKKIKISAIEKVVLQKNDKDVYYISVYMDKTKIRLSRFLDLNQISQQLCKRIPNDKVIIQKPSIILSKNPLVITAYSLIVAISYFFLVKGFN